MTDIAIRCEGLSKKYRIGERESYKALRDTLAEVVTAPFRRIRSINSERSMLTKERAMFWALRELSFEIKRGEIVGVIGRNGAGKSTLLKILSRITAPTEGEVEIRGRVGSLLEVGTGFHPELTGRENVFLNGAILGMRKAEISRRFDEIVAFAEIEKFIDTPVKRYSSGMYVRLAFAVAAHLEPEILIVDEVLAVGDAQFQKKCLGKMEDVAKHGRTVLFVSHNMQAINTLTNRGLVLSKGRCIADGQTDKVIAEYLREDQDEKLVYTNDDAEAEPRITRVELLTSEPNNVQINGKSMDVLIKVSTPYPVNGASISFQVVNSHQQPALHLWTFDSERPMCREAGSFQLVCHIPKLRLYMGSYRLIVHFTEGPGGRRFQTLEGICPFDVTMFGRNREFEWQPGTCTYLEECDWDISKDNSI